MILRKERGEKGTNLIGRRPGHGWKKKNRNVSDRANMLPLSQSGCFQGRAEEGRRNLSVYSRGGGKEFERK